MQEGARVADGEEVDQPERQVAFGERPALDVEGHAETEL